MTPPADDEPPGELGVLGVPPAEQAVYDALVGRPPVTVDDLREVLGGTAGPVAALDGLISKGLVSIVAGSPARYVAVAPDLALEVLLLDREKHLREARRYIDDLGSAYRAHVGAPTSTVLELVTGRDAVRQRIQQVQRAARSELRRLLKSPVDDRWLPQVEPLGDRAGCRTVYDSAALDARGTTVEELIGPAGAARVLPTLPMHLYLADDRLALMLQPPSADGDRSAVILHPCGLFDAFAETFERLWDRALPVHAPRDRPAADDREAQRLVTLLLSGLTDQAVARQLGVSPRTAQRQIAALMQGLGARTRFQAGAQAAIRDLAKD